MNLGDFNLSNPKKFSKTLPKWTQGHPGVSNWHPRHPYAPNLGLSEPGCTICTWVWKESLRFILVHIITSQWKCKLNNCAKSSRATGFRSASKFWAHYAASIKMQSFCSSIQALSLRMHQPGCDDYTHVNLGSLGPTWKPLQVHPSVQIHVQVNRCGIEPCSSDLTQQTQVGEINCLLLQKLFVSLKEILSKLGHNIFYNGSIML